MNAAAGTGVIELGDIQTSVPQPPSPSLKPATSTAEPPGRDDNGSSVDSTLPVSEPKPGRRPSPWQALREYSGVMFDLYMLSRIFQVVFVAGMSLRMTSLLAISSMLLAVCPTGLLLLPAYAFLAAHMTTPWMDTVFVVSIVVQVYVVLSELLIILSARGKGWRVRDMSAYFVTWLLVCTWVFAVSVQFAPRSECTEVTNLHTRLGASVFFAPITLGWGGIYAAIMTNTVFRCSQSSHLPQTAVIFAWLWMACWVVFNIVVIVRQYHKRHSTVRTPPAVHENGEKE